MLTYYFALTIMFVFTLATLFPQIALSVIAELKRQQRLRVIHYVGESIANEPAQDLHKFAARKGIDQALVDEVLEQNHDMIAERWEANTQTSSWANQIQRALRLTKKRPEGVDPPALKFSALRPFLFCPSLS